MPLRQSDWEPMAHRIGDTLDNCKIVICIPSGEYMLTRREAAMLAGSIFDELARTDPLLSDQDEHCTLYYKTQAERRISISRTPRPKVSVDDLLTQLQL